MLDKDADKARPNVQLLLAHWKRDTDLTGVRDPQALAKLRQTNATPGRSCGRMWTPCWRRRRRRRSGCVLEASSLMTRKAAEKTPKE